jgi:2-polyprenyl-3-methyl-5-hydroxy-6-metoxy-1,4-benzoquinol methylase
MSKQREVFRDCQTEQVRAYWNNRPCIIRHSPKPVGSKEYFDEVEVRKYRVEPHIPGFVEFPRWAGKRVPEINCGLGTDTINFARAGATVAAVDLSETSLELARRRADVLGLSNRITFYAADAERLSDFIFPEPFDLEYSFGVIHHTPHPERVVEQVRTHFVHPQSEFKLMAYHRSSWKVFWIGLVEGKSAFWRLDKLIARNSEAQTGYPVTYAYTPASIGRLLNGFHTQYRYVKNWYIRNLPRRIFRALERHFGRHLCLTARPNSV